MSGSQKNTGNGVYPGPLLGIHVHILPVKGPEKSTAKKHVQLSRTQGFPGLSGQRTLY